MPAEDYFLPRTWPSSYDILSWKKRKLGFLFYTIQILFQRSTLITLSKYNKRFHFSNQVLAEYWLLLNRTEGAIPTKGAIYYCPPFPTAQSVFPFLQQISKLMVILYILGKNKPLFIEEVWPLVAISIIVYSFSSTLITRSVNIKRHPKRTLIIPDLFLANHPEL